MTRPVRISRGLARRLELEDTAAERNTRREALQKRLDEASLMRSDITEATAREITASFAGPERGPRTVAGILWRYWRQMEGVGH